MHVVDISHYDEHQQYALTRILSFIFNIPEQSNLTPIILSANAGSGKTTLLREACKGLLKTGIKFAVAAYTGRAVSTLTKEGLSNASTLHSLLLTPLLDENGDLIRFEDKSDKEVAEQVGRVLIIDEASMIPSDMFNRIYTICQNYKIKLIFSGDIAQLPPISEDEFNVMEFDEAEVLPLVVNYRQKDGSGIADLAMYLRENNSIPMRKSSDLRVIRKSVITKIDFHRKNSYDVILCGTNRMRRKLNALVRQARGFDEEVPVEGETIICKRNDVVGNMKINNGELYVVETRFPSSLKGAHDFLLRGIDKRVTVQVTIPDSAWSEEGEFGRKIQGRNVHMFSFGYAITVHAAQGSQFSKVLFVDEDVSFFMKDNQIKWRYTAVSRAQDMLTIAR